MHSEDPQQRALDTIALMRRENLSLTAAAKRAGTTMETVVRHAGRALEKPSSGWVAKSFERYARSMEFSNERDHKVVQEDS